MRPEPADLSAVSLVSVHDRATRVNVDQLGRPIPADADVATLLASLPAILGASALRDLARAMADAVRAERPVLLGLGGHVIKCGCGPLLVDALERGLISGVLLNGGAAIHDVELALFGRTSEDVGQGLRDGTFGMVDETGDYFWSAVEAASDGLGTALGEGLHNAPHAHVSVLAAAARLRKAAMVTVAFGADTVHMHPAIDAAALGAAAHVDFRRLVAILQQLRGGIYLNCGSAVQLPEVFLKALTLARNLSDDVDGFVTADLDLQRHYRPGENVLRRPGGRSIAVNGHHELMLPLLFVALKQELARG